MAGNFNISKKEDNKFDITFSLIRIVSRTEKVSVRNAKNISLTMGEDLNGDPKRYYKRQTWQSHKKKHVEKKSKVLFNYIGEDGQRN